ncbi:MAG: hypothetical protein WBP41_05800, partial [Saprospiraceae bacterium]
SVVTATLTSSQTYTVTITDANGATGTSSQIVTVIAQPVGPTLNSKSPTNATICSGQVVSATFTSGSGGDGCSDDYQVIIDGGSPSAYTPGSNVGGSATSTIVIQGRRANCAGGSGCNGTSYVTLASWVVVPQPTSPTVNIITPNVSTVCAGTDVDATFHAGTGGTGCSDIYQYSTNNGSTWNPYTPGDPISTTGATVVLIQASRGNCASGSGCNGTGFATLVSWEVNSVTPGVVAASQTICSGDDPAPFTQTTASTGTGTLTYRWESSLVSCSSGFSAIGGATSSTYDPPSGLTQTRYYRRITISTLNGFACEAATNCIVITVNPLPVCSITGSGIVCPSSNGNVFTAPSGLSYSWSISGTGSISGSSTSQSVAVDAGVNCNSDFTLFLTVTDGNSCSSTCSKVVTVIDNTVPVVTGSLSMTTLQGCSEGDAPGAVTTLGSLEALPGNLVVTDNCTAHSGLVVSSSQSTTGTCPIVMTRIYKVTDACSNTSVNIVHTIRIEDVTPPVISSLPAPTTIGCPAIPSFAVATATDACGSAFTLTSVDVTSNGACAGSYSVTRTWTATDACGNSSTTSQTINVQDVTAPVIASLPAPSTINCPSIPSFAVATASDACGSAYTLTSEDVSNSGACAGSYSVTRTWTATDGCGNSSTASQTINVQDVTAPVIATLPSTSTINCPATPSFAVATAIDACGSAFTLTSDDVTTNGAC